MASFVMLEVPVTRPPHRRRSFCMVKPFVRRPVTWMLLVGLLTLVLALSACGDSGNATTPTPTAQPTTAVSAATITIREKTGGQDVYTFEAPSVTIKAGQAVTFDNQSD